MKKFPQNTYPRKASERDVASLDLEEQWHYANLRVGAQTPHPTSKGALLRDRVWSDEITAEWKWLRNERILDQCLFNLIRLINQLLMAEIKYKVPQEKKRANLVKDANLSHHGLNWTSS